MTRRSRPSSQGLPCWSPGQSPPASFLCCMQTPEAGVGRSCARDPAWSTLDPVLCTALRVPSIPYRVELQCKFVQRETRLKTRPPEAYRRQPGAGCPQSVHSGDDHYTCILNQETEAWGFNQGHSADQLAK